MEHRIVLSVQGGRWEQFSLTLDPWRARQLLGLIETLEAMILGGLMSFELRFRVREGEWHPRGTSRGDPGGDPQARSILVVRVGEVLWKATLAGLDGATAASTSPITKDQLKFFACKAE